MSAEAQTIGIADADAVGNHVVDHAGEFIDRVDRGAPAFTDEAQARLFEAVHGARTFRGPHNIRERAEQTVKVLLVRFYEAVGE